MPILFIVKKEVITADKMCVSVCVFWQFVVFFSSVQTAYICVHCIYYRKLEYWHVVCVCATHLNSVSDKNTDIYVKGRNEAGE